MYKKIYLIWTSWLLFLAFPTFAQIVTPLPADQAFLFSVQKKSSKVVIAEWQIAPGYYLYRKRIHFNFEPPIAARITYPQGEYHFDSNQTRQEVFSGHLMIPIELTRDVPQLTISVNYQGCSASGFCYPPIHKEISLATSAIDSKASSATTFATLLTDQHAIQTVLQTHHIIVSWLIFLIIGFLLSLTPCIFPMVPILAAIIAGTKQTATKHSLYLSSSYVLGMSFAYAIAGVAAALFGHSLQVWLQQPIFIILGSCIFILLGLSLFGLFELTLPQRLLNFLSHCNAHQGGTLKGAFYMGALSTLIVSPCVTAPLIGVLLYIGQVGNPWLGGSALFMMGLGMGTPLLIIGLSANKWLPKSGPWMQIIKKSFGLIMFMMALWLLSRILAKTVLFYLSLSCGVIFLFFFANRFLHQRSWRLKTRYTTSSLLCLGLLISGMTYQHHLQQQIQQKLSTQGASFKLVHSIREFDQQLELAQANQQPILMDFYADWCESCIDMDKHVFAQPDVKSSLNNFILLRVDLSQNNANDEAMMNYFHVIAPPTILFFTQGKEVAAYRIVGELNKPAFLQRINAFLSPTTIKR